MGYPQIHKRAIFFFTLVFVSFVSMKVWFPSDLVLAREHTFTIHAPTLLLHSVQHVSTAPYCITHTVIVLVPKVPPYEMNTMTILAVYMKMCVACTRWQWSLLKLNLVFIFHQCNLYMCVFTIYILYSVFFYHSEIRSFGHFVFHFYFMFIWSLGATICACVCVHKLG